MPQEKFQRVLMRDREGLLSASRHDELTERKPPWLGKLGNEQIEASFEELELVWRRVVFATLPRLRKGGEQLLVARPLWFVFDFRHKAMGH